MIKSSVGCRCEIERDDVMKGEREVERSVVMRAERDVE
jgi:hypothetical protein